MGELEDPQLDDERSWIMGAEKTLTGAVGGYSSQCSSVRDNGKV